MNGDLGQPEAKFFFAGGTVPPGSPSYVERASDRELYECLRSGEYAFVLNSRQMGKSSLAVRTIARLAKEGARCAFIDLTRLGGATVTPEQWYAGLLVETGRSLGLRTEAVAYLRQNHDIGPSQRYLGFIQEVALVNSDSDLILMIDEIDAVRSLPFSTDELFVGIRQLYNGRASNATLKRLTVCLLGAALPSDLVSDPRTTPFNIGKRIGLRDFSREEAQQLISGLGSHGSQILDRVFYWTNGHPYLTQVLCADLSQGEAPVPGDVDRLVQERYLDARARDTDTNLADLANRLLGRGDPAVSDSDRADTLTLYVRMLKRGIVDDEGNPSSARIKMSGACRIKGGRLYSRNRIYSTVFGPRWAKENMPRQETLRQRRAFLAGVFRTALVSSLAVIIVACFAFIAFKGAGIAHEAQLKAQAANEESRKLANAESAAKLDALKKAEEARRSLKRELAAEAVAKQSMSQEHSAKVAAQRSEAAERLAQQAAIASANNAKWNERIAERLLYASNMGLASAALSGGSSMQVSEDLAEAFRGAKGGNRQGWEFRFYEALLREGMEYPIQGAGISMVGFSPSGHLLTLCGDNRLSAWATDRPEMLGTISPRGGQVAMSRDGRVVVQARPNGSFDIRNPDGFGLLRNVKGVGIQARQIQLAEDGSKLLGQVNDSNWMLDMREDNVQSSMRIGTGHTKMVILPDGDCIVPRNQGLIRVTFRNGKGSAVLWSSPGRVDTQRAFAVSSDGRYGAFSDSWGYVQIVDLHTGRWIGKPLIQSAMVTAIAFAPDSSMIVTASDDGVIKLATLPDGQTARTFRSRQGHICTVALSDDGQIGYGTTDGYSGIFSPRRFDRPSGVLNVGEGPLSCVAVSPDGRWLAAAAALGKSFRLVDSRTGKIRSIYPSNGAFVSFDYSPDGKSIAVSEGGPFPGDPHFVGILDIESGKMRSLKSGTRTVCTVKYSPDGKRIVVSEGSSQVSNSTEPALVELLDAQSGRLIRKAEYQTGWIPGVAFSPDGKLLAAPHGSGTTYLYGASTLNQIGTMQVDRRFTSGIEGDVCSSVCFSQDGRSLLIGRSSGTIDIYDVATRTRIGGWAAHTGRVTGIDFVPGGGTLVTISDDRHAKFWASGDWRNLGDVQYATQVSRVAVSTADDTVYIGDGSGNVHAMRTKGVPLQSAFKPVDHAVYSWEGLHRRAQNAHKPILVGILDSTFAGSTAYREFLQDPMVRRILDRHFIVFDPLPSEPMSADGHVTTSFAFFNSRFELEGGFPWTKVFGSDGTMLWDGKINLPGRRGARVNIGAPQADWEIEGYLGRLAGVSPSLSKGELAALRQLLHKLVSPSQTSNPPSFSAASAQRTNYQWYLDRNDLTGAMRELDRFTSLEPMAVTPHEYRGRVLSAMGKWREAADEYQRGSGILRPAYDQHFWQMMCCLLLAGDSGEFSKRLRSIVEPDWEFSIRSRALRLECIGFGLVPNPADPRQTAERIRRRFAQELDNPSNVLLNADYSLILARAGRLPEAETLIHRCMADPLLPVSDRKFMEHRRIYLALVLALKGDREGARGQLSRAEADFGLNRNEGQLMAGLPDAANSDAANESECQAIFTVLRREVKLLLGPN